MAAAPGYDDGYDLVFRAMAHRQLGDRERAAGRLQKAARWMVQNPLSHDDLDVLLLEAAEILGPPARND